MANIHQGLRTEVLAEHSGAGVRFSLSRVVHGRDAVSYGVHASAFERFLSPGIDRDELLARIGFGRTACPFTRSNDSYCLEVTEEFDLERFAGSFAKASAALRAADRAFDRCGFFLESREFPAKDWINTRGDGHTGAVLQRFAAEDTEDANFQFVLSWVGRSEGDGGWTTHIRAKEQPLSAELGSAMSFLGLEVFEECIEFDFQPCHWRNVRREARGDFDGNNETAFGWFRALPEHFSSGLRDLLEANKELSAFGFDLLPGQHQPRHRARVAPVRPPEGGAGRDGVTPGRNEPDLRQEFDVAISYAGPDREYAETLATLLHGQGVRVFYDRFFQSSLWGKDLPTHFDRVFRQQARFCVMFISEAYRDREWTILERRSALARMVAERGGEYVLPVVIQHVDLEGLPPTIGHVSLAEAGLEEIAQMLVEKLRSV